MYERSWYCTVALGNISEQSPLEAQLPLPLPPTGRRSQENGPSLHCRTASNECELTANHQSWSVYPNIFAKPCTHVACAIAHMRTHQILLGTLDSTSSPTEERRSLNDQQRAPSTTRNKLHRRSTTNFTDNPPPLMIRCLVMLVAHVTVKEPDDAAKKSSRNNAITSSPPELETCRSCSNNCALTALHARESALRSKFPPPLFPNEPRRVMEAVFRDCPRSQSAEQTHHSDHGVLRHKLVPELLNQCAPPLLRSPMPST